MAKPVGLQRRVYLFGHSWVVAVPKRVRDHLRMKSGGAVYWHLTGPREALVTRTERRIGGKPPGLDLADELAAAHHLIERLRRKLAERPQRVFNQGATAGVAIVQRIGHVFDDRLRVVHDELAAIRAELGMRPPRPVRRGRRPGPARQRPVETLLLPGEKPPFPPYPSPSEPGESAEVTGPA